MVVYARNDKLACAVSLGKTLSAVVDNNDRKVAAEVQTAESKPDAVKYSWDHHRAVEVFETFLAVLLEDGREPIPTCFEFRELVADFASFIIVLHWVEHD